MAILPRQAVLLVHGIGEQRPHETLRSFVRLTDGRKKHGIVPDTAAVYGAPDQVSGRLDTRKLKVTWDQRATADHLGLQDEARKTTGIRTDFFEYYWAPSFRDTSWRHVRSWVIPILFRDRKKILSPRFRGPDAPVARAVHWLLLILGAVSLMLMTSAGPSLPRWGAIALVAGFAAAIVLSSWLGVVTLVRSIAVAGVVATFVVTVGWPEAAPEGWPSRVAAVVVVPLITTALAGFFIRGVGDAARYFDDRPANVNETEAVRRAALKMIQDIHEERDPRTQRFRYDRLVVVGHSLGSVIAYDAVRLAWNQNNRSLLFPKRGARDPVSNVVARVEQEARRVRAAGEAADATRAAFRSAQQSLYRLLRDGRPASHRDGGEGRWIISDLVTLGSPLAYADVFLAKNHEDLVDRIDERVLASCPPQYQKTADGHFFRFAVGKEHSCLHQAAVFAAVRWTNMFFPHDYVGGPVAPIFGAGIEDVELGEGSDWPGWFALSYPHSSYWQAPRRRERNENGFELCLRELQDIIQPNPVLLILMKRDQPPTTETDVLRISEILQETSGVDADAPALVADVRLLANTRRGVRDYVWVPGPSPARITRRSVEMLQEWAGDRGKVTVRTSYPD